MAPIHVDGRSSHRGRDEGIHVEPDSIGASPGSRKCLQIIPQKNLTQNPKT
ncbi:hypothetical protein HMPREF9056_02943 [Actinomyces sp. oral taxon 170 str. F0386]|nr:hypothetical protein HMPREF9056_02943 [Actinomyces sp. oral taxon 170 str. F0386]